MPLIEAAGAVILLRAMKLDAVRIERLGEIEAGRAHAEALPMRGDEEPVDESGLEGKDAGRHARDFRHETTLPLGDGLEEALARQGHRMVIAEIGIGLAAGGVG